MTVPEHRGANAERVPVRVTLDVFGARYLAIRGPAGWQVFRLGPDGKRSAADIPVPDFVGEGELAQYFDDLFHELATPGRPIVFRIE